MLDEFYVSLGLISVAAEEPKARGKDISDSQSYFPSFLALVAAAVEGSQVVR